MILRAGRFRHAFPGPALIMGVLNVTPDSFSDGGQFFDPEVAVDHGLQLLAEGADMIDVGGESSRPGAIAVPEEEELRRVIPVIGSLARQMDKPLSIDTVKPAVAEKALEAGASIINDVGANRDQSAMWRLAAKSGAGYVLMHAQGSPPTMQSNPHYDDVTSEVQKFFEDRLSRLGESGVGLEQVMLDVGIGFGKNAGHNLQLLFGLRSFTKWDRPLLVGVSRKSFVGNVTGAGDVAGRLPGSLACACWAIAAGARIIRTHDVAATRQAVRMTEAILTAEK
jgi:dihydropteroate synthase